MPPGLKDVAKRAGVSIKTVSNVVNGYAHVAADTRARVQGAIAELGYRPNVAARQLRGGRSGVIALALPDLRSAYFAELASMIVQAAEKRHWTVLIDQTGGRADRERDLAGRLRRHLIDGLIFSPLAMAAGEIAVDVPDTPMVLLGERVWHGPADHVAVDNTAAAADATRHLCELGRRRIAAIGAQDGPVAVSAQQRLAGYRAALEQHGRTVDPALIAPAAEFHRADGAAAMGRLLDSGEPPDAVFCFNDLLALGAIRTLLDRGYAVPGDVAVVGFDDIEEGRFSTPTLTTVSPDTAGIARLAVELLAERLDQPLTGDGAAAEPSFREIRVEHRVVPRESTLGRLAARRR
ncbi:LacI family DNA-binding transcriptional regulator [Actinoplanes aureus]|uniref:LacI family DNA-binding transcriptional regulator n=1 Tax=Actinoplanes aureus TaxID=2792083 RepID=A0A931G066_9ACTN|nr:LacI family DNA-binding transcriptional regulator [Actinoplanes aureus]MBG0565467.1 LacI family DNA-binding transcriptional regulator [Actinoplanes aureus]